MKQYLPPIFICLLFFSIDTSAQWTSNGPYGGVINCIALSGSNIFAGTGGGGVFLSTDNGNTWSARNSGLGNTQISALAINGSYIFAGVEYGGVYLSTNNGNSWKEINNGMPYGAYITAFAQSGATIYAGTQNNGLLFSTDSGGTWAQANDPDLTTRGVSSLLVFGSCIIEGAGLGVYVSTNNGADWQWSYTGLSNSAVTALAVSGSVVYAGTGDLYGYPMTTSSGIYMSLDSGLTWGFSDLNDSAITALYVNGDTVYAGTQTGGVCFHTGNDGWQRINNGLTNTAIMALAGNGSSIIAGTNGGGIFISGNSGLNWSSANNGLEANSYNSFAANDSIIFAASSNGVYLSKNNGLSWALSNKGFQDNGYSTDTFVSLVFIHGSSIFAGTYYDSLFVSNDNGASWQSANRGLPSTYFSSAFISDSGILLSTNNSLYLSKDNGGNWTALTGDSSITTGVQAFAQSGSDIYAGIYYYGMYLSSDQGITWQLVDSGLANKYVWGATATGSGVFAGTQNGVFRTGNQGATWVPVDSGLPVPTWVYCMASAGSTIFAGTDTSGVYFSNNNGATWLSANTGLPAVTTVYSILIQGANVFLGTNTGIYQQPLANFVCQSKSDTINAGICSGSSYLFNSRQLTVAGFYSDTLTASGGCDSIVILHLTVNPVVTPTLSISSNLGSKICAGNIGTFRATATNQGASPIYTWKLNGATVQSDTSPQYIKLFEANTILGNNFRVSCQLTSDAACASPVKVNSDTLRMTLSTKPIRSAIIGQAKGVCGGSTWTYTCDEVPGATIYQWTVPTGCVIDSGQTTTSITVTFPANYDSAKISVVAANNCGVGAPAYLTVKCSTRSEETGEEELPIEGDIKLNIYPNPNNGQMYIELEQTEPAPVSYKVFNVMGQIVHEYSSAEPVPSFQQWLDLGTQPSGMYFIQMRAGETVLNRSVVVTK